MVIFSLAIAVILLTFQLSLFFLARRAVDGIVVEWQKEAMAPVNSMLSGIELMKGLDHRFVTHRYFEYLRRAGTAAPMVGVGVSALTLLASSQQVPIGDSGGAPLILRDVFFGVLVGVLLSCVNQGLLALLYRTYHLRRQTVSLQVNEVNMAAVVSRATGDLKVQIEEATQLLKRRFSAAMDECASLVSVTQQRLAKENQIVAETVAATTSLHKRVSEFLDKVLPARMESSVNAAMTQVTLEFGKLHATLARQVQEVNHAIAQCANTQAQAERSVEKITDSAKSVDGVVEGFRVAAETLRTGMAELSGTALPQLRLAIEKLSGDTQTVSKAIQKVPMSLTAGFNAFQETATESAGVAAALTNSARLLQGASQQLDASASVSADRLEKVSQVAEQRMLTGTLPMLQQLEKSVAGSTDSLRRTVEALAQTTQPVASVVANADKLLRDIAPLFTDLTATLKNLQLGSREVLVATERQAALLNSWSTIAEDLPQKLETRISASIDAPLQGLTNVVNGTQRLVVALESLLQQLAELADTPRTPQPRPGILGIFQRGR